MANGHEHAKEYEENDPYAQPNRFSHELSSDIVGMFLKEVEGPESRPKERAGDRALVVAVYMHGSDMI